MQQDLPASLCMVLAVFRSNPGDAMVRVRFLGRGGEEVKRGLQARHAMIGATAFGSNFAASLPELRLPNPTACHSNPQIELTDGWYRIRAQLDGDLAAVCGAGRLRPGVKLRVVGARLQSPAPNDPLAAFASSTLLLHANGTHRQAAVPA